MEFDRQRLLKGVMTMTTLGMYREQLRTRLHQAVEALLPFTDEPDGYIPNEDKEADDFMLPVWGMDAAENMALVAANDGTVYVYLKKTDIATVRGISPDGVMDHTISLHEGWYALDKDRLLTVKIGDYCLEHTFNLFDRTSLRKLLSIVCVLEQEVIAKAPLSV